MQEHPVFVLFDAGGNLEQRENDGLGLSRGQRRALQAELAQLLVQDIRRGGQEQAGKVGEEGRS